MGRKKKKSRAQIALGVVFIAILFIVMIVNIVVPDRQDAQGENRMLASKPQLSLGNIMSGDLAEKYEDYVSDQFVGSSLLRAVKVGLDRIGGGRLENGVYIGKGGQLLADIEVAQPEQLTANLDAIESFALSSQDIPVRMILAPDAASILSDKLPMLVSVENQTQMISMVKKELEESVEWIDVSTALNKHKNEKIYYKTDDNWTALGAFYAFQAAAPALGIEEDVSDKYVSYTVSDSFHGMLAAKSGVGLDEKEQIDIYVPKDSDNDVIVNYVDEGKRTTSLYDSSKLGGEEYQYGVYLGGDASVLDIKTVSTETKRLLLVKDSFANCFIPFLTPYYREIVVVDPRYYSGTIEDIMDSYRITEVLFLYSGNTFFSDNNISGVFAGE